MTISCLKLSGNTPVDNDALNNVATNGANKLRYFLISMSAVGLAWMYYSQLQTSAFPLLRLSQGTYRWYRSFCYTSAFLHMPCITAGRIAAFLCKNRLIKRHSLGCGKSSTKASKVHSLSVGATFSRQFATLKWVASPSAAMSTGNLTETAAYRLHVLERALWKEQRTYEGALTLGNSAINTW